MVNSHGEEEIINGKGHVVDIWGAGSVLFPDLGGVIWVFSLNEFVKLYVQVVCIFPYRLTSLLC